MEKALVVNGLFCATCKAVHVNPSPRDQALAKVWGFFLCSMSEKPHCDESFTRNSLIYDGVRMNVFTGEIIPLEDDDDYKC